MRIGMLWFNNDPKMSFKDKIEGALKYYQLKYGKNATAVFVSPSETDINYPDTTIEIKKNRSVLPNHYWIGVKENE